MCLVPGCQECTVTAVIVRTVHLAVAAVVGQGTLMEAAASSAGRAVVAAAAVAFAVAFGTGRSAPRESMLGIRHKI